MIARLLAVPLRVREHRFKRCIHCLNLVAVYFIVAMLLIKVSDHVFSEQATIRYYAKMLAPVLAKDYDGRAPLFTPAATGPLKRAQDLTTVFLVQDADLEEYDEPYPVRYQFWARRLAALAEYKPRAVFLDVFFIDKRNDPTLGAFIQQACDLRHDGRPVYIGSLAPRGLHTRPEIKAARTTLDDGSSVPCFTEVAIPKPMDRFDPSAWEYTLIEKPVPGSRAPQAQARESVAARIYQDLGGNLALEDAESMALIWGARPHADNAVLRPADRNASTKLACKDANEDPSWFKVIGNLAKRIVSSNKLGTSDAAECYYHRMRPITQLREASEETLTKLIGGRVVMIAMDVAGLQDVVYSPVAQMAIPGVFLHAMALDNLMVFGERYKQHVELQLFKNAAGNFALAILFILCVATAVMDVYLPELKKKLAAWNAAEQAHGRAQRNGEIEHRRLERRRLHDGATPHAEQEEAEESALAGVENVTLSNPILMAIAVIDRARLLVTGFTTDHAAVRDLPKAPLGERLRRGAARLLASGIVIPALKVIITVLLSVGIFYVGYFVMNLGPLTWVEFVFFPVLCHFLFVGPRVEKMFADAEEAGHVWLNREKRIPPTKLPG